MIDDTQNIILVVDDSPDSLGMINTALDTAGYTVLVALNGSQALTIAEKIKPSVILLDANMPVMNGFECCPKLRAILPLTPIIFMTGLTDIEHIVKAFEAGGNDYICKPIRPQDLMVRIKMHCKNADFITNARDALDLARQYVFSVKNSGDLCWATPEAEQILDGLKQSIKFKKAIALWLTSQPKPKSLSIEIDSSSITLQYIKKIGEKEHLARLIQPELIFTASALQKLLPLTKREAEVLLWIAHGKSNKEIADILDMSPRTVNKHLEQIYPKINAENRSGATSIAIKLLLGFSDHPSIQHQL